MVATVRQVIVNDPNPSVFNWFQAGFGGTSILAMITDPGTDTLAGSLLTGFASQAYDGSNVIARIQDPVNGNWNTVDTLLNTTSANSHNLSAYKENAQPLKQVAATFNGSVIAAAKTLTLTSDASAPLHLGDHITGSGLPANSVLFALNSGSASLNGAVYQINSQVGFTDTTNQAYSAANAIMVVFTAANDYQGGVFLECTGCATSSPLAGHNAHNDSPVGSSADNCTSGTANCGTNPVLMLGYYFNGGVITAPYAGTAGTGFTNTAAILQYNIGSKIARWEWDRFTNPGTKAATITSGGTDQVSTMMMAFSEPSSSPPGISSRRLFVLP